MSLIRLIYKGHCGFIRVTLSCPVCLSLSLISCFGRSQEPEPCGEDPSFTSESCGGSLIWFHRRESTKEGKEKNLIPPVLSLDCFLFSFLFLLLLLLLHWVFIAACRFSGCGMGLIALTHVEFSSSTRD